MNPREIQSAAASRGIGYQAVGFIAVALITLAILKTFQGSAHWTYQTFALAIDQLYWALLVPLAALFERIRKMFETRAQIREGMKEEGRIEGRVQGIAQGIAQANAETRARMERAGLPPETIALILGDTPAPPANGGIDPHLESNIKRLIHEALDERDNR